MKKLLIGFLLVTEHADPRRDCACIENEDAVLLFFTVNSYAQGEQYAKVLAALGCVGIELCPGFGNEGVARIQKAVGPHTGGCGAFRHSSRAGSPLWRQFPLQQALKAPPLFPINNPPQDADNPICILWGFFFPRFNQYRLRTSRYCTMASRTPSKPSTALLSVRS